MILRPGKDHAPDTTQYGWQPTGGEASPIWGTSYEPLLANTHKALDSLHDDNGLHNILDVSAHMSRGHDLTTVVRRSIISSSFVVLMGPKMIYRKVGADEHLIGLSSGWDRSAEIQAVEDVLRAGEFQDNKFCILLPRTIDISVETSGGERMEIDFERAEAANQEITSLLKRVYSVPVGANYAMVRRLMKQDEIGSTINSGVVMPDIRNLSLGDLTRLRSDYDDSFARIRYALKRYLDGVANPESEDKFRGIIEEIDHEVRTAEDEFQRIAKKHSRSLKGMLVASSITGVAAITALFAPDAAAAISTAIGAVGASNLFAQRVKRLDEVDDMRKSDYWIAWKIHRENAAKAS